MKIHLLKKKATAEQMSEMLESLENYIKLAVDVKKEILAGGGILHADCEAVLLEDGSIQEDVWGADWLPFTQEVTYESLIKFVRDRIISVWKLKTKIYAKILKRLSEI